jgi:hypothetical protein
MLLAGLLLALSAPALDAAPAGPGTSGAWILNCRIDDAARTVRTFRVAPRLLQEWKPADKRFGPNLCETFSCKADRERLEGTISSASLILTLSVDPRNGRGSWKTVGASGLKQTTGPCDAKREAPGQKKPG